MQIGICASPDQIAGLPEFPFDFIEGSVQTMLQGTDESAFSAWVGLMRACPRPMPAANCFLPADLKVTGPAPDLERLETYAATVCRRAEALGIGTIVFGSGGARRVPEGFSTATGFAQFVEALGRVGRIAQRHRITIVVEPLNTAECNIVNTVDQGAEAVRKADHPNVRLLVDLYHMLVNGESPDPILRHADLIWHAHVAEKQDRRQPGVNGDDFVPFLRALRNARHCSRLTIECRWDPPMPTGVGPAVGVLRRQLTAAGFPPQSFPQPSKTSTVH